MGYLNSNCVREEWGFGPIKQLSVSRKKAVDKIDKSGMTSYHGFP